MPDMSAMMNGQGGGMPDMGSLMGQGGMPDMSQMPDLSALMGGGGAKPKMPKGIGAFIYNYTKKPLLTQYLIVSNSILS